MTLRCSSGYCWTGLYLLHSVREENEGIPCKYGLRNGSYTINPDGSGRTDGQWKFMEGGGSGWKCFDLGLPKNGMQSGGGKPGAVFKEKMLATKSGARSYH